MIESGPVLVEREHELARISAFVDGVTVSSPQLLVLEGPAGIGKTTLLRSAREQLRTGGCLVLDALGSELETDLAFGVARQLFHRPPLEQPGLLTGPAALAAAALGFDPGASDPPGPDAAHAAFHGLHWLCLSLVERAPLVLCIDDAQWVDAESLRWLDYVVRRMAGLRMGILVTVRTGETSGNDPLLAALRTEELTEVLRPRPLSLAATSSLVLTRADQATEAFCVAAHRLCNGNPFLLEELINTCVSDAVPLDDEGAQQLEALASGQLAQGVLARISRGSRAGVELARAVAVLGASASLSRAAQLAALDEAEAMQLTERLAAADVFAADATLQFRHPLVRQSVYADVAPASRAARHRAAAQLLLDEEAPDDEIVAQLLLSEPVGDITAVTVLRRAAARAVSSGAPAAAVAMLRRSLEEPIGQMRVEVLLELGIAETAVDPPAAVAHLELALNGEAGARRVDAVLALAAALNLVGETRRALALLAAERAVLSETDSTAAARLAVAGGLLNALTATSRTEIHRDCSVLAGRTKDPVAHRSLCALLALAAPAARERAQWAEDAWAAGKLVDDLGPEALLAHALAGGLAQDGLLERALEVSSTLLDAAQRRGSLLGSAMATGTRSGVHLAAGRLLDAETDAAAALEAGQSMGWPVCVQAGAAALAHALIERGRLDDADEVLAQVPASTEPMYVAVLTARGELRLRQHRVAEAVEDARAAGALNPGADDDLSRHHLVLVRALSAAGDMETARALAAQRLGRARELQIAAALADAILASALVADPGDAVRTWTDAVAELEGLPFPIPLTRAQVHLGAALRRARQVSEARVVLQRARDVAMRLHAGLLAAHAADELAAAGVRAPRVATTGVEALSPSERRVCQLAADGLSNSQIAQTLFVSVKTVETQLSSAYRKLQIPGRGALRGALAED